MLINGREKVGTEILKNLKAFVDYSQILDDVYENMEDYNPKKEKEKVNSLWWYDSKYWV